MIILWWWWWYRLLPFVSCIANNTQHVSLTADLLKVIHEERRRDVNNYNSHPLLTQQTSYYIREENLVTDTTTKKENKRHDQGMMISQFLSPFQCFLLDVLLVVLHLVFNKILLFIPIISPSDFTLWLLIPRLKAIMILYRVSFSSHDSFLEIHSDRNLQEKTVRRKTDRLWRIGIRNLRRQQQ